MGEETYAIWVEMLRTLVPYGRSHRLSVVIAGMLQYSADLAYRSTGGKAPQGSAAASLLLAAEELDPKKIAHELGDLLTRLFHDAKVPAQRTGARGDRYSILDSALQEYLAWDSMPWE